MKYPSPGALKGTTVQELGGFLRNYYYRFGDEKAREILDSAENTTVRFQEIRDNIVQSTIKQIYFIAGEIETIDDTLADFLKRFDCTLTSICGVSVITAAQILSCIGDIKKFPTPAKLARYAGIAPVTYSSGKKDLQFANRRGNRELNYLIYNLALRLTIAVGPTHKVINSFFYDYYHRKISDGKTKQQALKCVQRRLVNIIWGMMNNVEDYVNPPMFELAEENETEETKVI
jgi:transposase